MIDTGLNSDVSKDDIFAMLAGDILPAHIHARRRAEARGQKIADAQLRWEAHYEQFPTVKLLDMREFTTPFEVMCKASIDAEGNDVFSYGYGWREDGSFTEEQYVNQIAKERALKAVLNRRPHVPNKVEKETARRAAATAHHGPKKKGGNKYTNRERAARAQKLADKQASRRSERRHKRDFFRW